MQNNLVETLIGAAVVIVALFFLSFAYRTSDAAGVGPGYTLTARVTNVTGITVGTDVRIAGIKVGTVSKLALDPQTYEAILSLNIDKKFELGEDTSMSVATESLLGGSFIAIQPGADFENILGDGDQIVFATGTVDLLSLIQQAIFGAGGSSKEAQAPASAIPAGGPSTEPPATDKDAAPGIGEPPAKSSDAPKPEAGDKDKPSEEEGL